MSPNPANRASQPALDAYMSPSFRVRRCGPYVLGRRIGAGGMAAVFAAKAGGDSRLVALKVMSLALSGDEALHRMFLREASIATRLEHPNVVRTYEVGQADGEMFLVMELLSGATLSALQSASREPTPLPVVVRIIGDVARALHAAHELRGPDGERLDLVHQDVSPQNVMVTYDGTTKLLDFGVARVGSVDASRTESVRGKLSYLAPEQVNLGSLDRRVDVFALGILLHELLTGCRLFRRENAAASLDALLLREIPSVLASRPDLPPAVADVASRALRYAAEDRFATTEALRLALTAAAGNDGAGDAEIGDWARGLVPPAWSHADLEHEIAEGTMSPLSPPESAAELAELPTETPQRVQATPLPPSRLDADVRAFEEDPPGRDVVGKTYLCWCVDSSLCITVVWGAPDLADLRILTRLCEVAFHPKMDAPYLTMIDVQHLDGLPPRAFAHFSEYVVRRGAALGTRVRRQAIIRPAGIVGAIAAGFFPVFGTPYPTSVVTNRESGLVSLERPDAHVLAKELEARVDAARRGLTSPTR